MSQTITVNAVRKLRVHRWHLKRTDTADAICIRAGKHYICIPMADARKLVDAVHDFADEYDAERRKTK